ncbi:hypothetical protein [Streptomyces sp. NBC_00271]|uniref:hypothetical protein n=1 Tax=Streptomyces sp. NBC_00271 TaxID=2975697 RepID=UPI003FA70897
MVEPHHPAAGRTHPGMVPHPVRRATRCRMARDTRAPASHGGVSDPTAIRLQAAHTLAVTETALAFLTDARRHGAPCRPLNWICEVHHPIPAGRHRPHRHREPDQCPARGRQGPKVVPLRARRPRPRGLADRPAPRPHPPIPTTQQAPEQHEHASVH